MKNKSYTVVKLSFFGMSEPEYFESIKSIFSYHSVEEIGCNLEYLSRNINENNPFINSKVKIEITEVR